MSAKTTTKPKNKSTQTFIRLNVDAKLDNLLKKYEAQYHLLNRGDIIRMLISQVDYTNSNLKLNSTTMDETQYLLSSQANKAMLEKSIQELKVGKANMQTKTLQDLEAMENNFVST